MASAALAVGEIIAGRYEIEERLGEGGMAVVYRARHTGTDRPCALKFLHPELAQIDKHREQFLNEARVAGRIGAHPHVVDVFDTGTDDSRQLPFIAMELLQGTTLSKFAATEGPIDWPTARRLLVQLADALDAAHRAGVIHRDLKPTNVFVTRDRAGELQVKVLDFGIAKVLEETEGDRTATQVGTPWYSAPEQLGSSIRKLAAERGVTIATGVSPATDVWAYGLVVYELLCGVQPKKYWGSLTMADQMIKVALDDRAPATERAGARADRLPPGFDGWFLRCLRHDAAERFPAAGAAAEALSALLTGEPASRPAPSFITTPGQPSPLASPPPSSPSTPGAPVAAPGDLSRPDGAGPGQFGAAAVAEPHHQPDTASSWQEIAPAGARPARLGWVVAGSVGLAIALGGTVALLTVGPTAQPSPIHRPSPGASGVDEPASAPATADRDATAEPAPSTSAELAGAGGSTAEAPPATATPPAPTAAPVPAGRTAATAVTTPGPSPSSPAVSSPPRPPRKGFDELFGTR